MECAEYTCLQCHDQTRPSCYLGGSYDLLPAWKRFSSFDSKAMYSSVLMHCDKYCDDPIERVEEQWFVWYPSNGGEWIDDNTPISQRYINDEGKIMANYMNWRYRPAGDGSWGIKNIPRVILSKLCSQCTSEYGHCPASVEDCESPVGRVCQEICPCEGGRCPTHCSGCMAFKNCKQMRCNKPEAVGCKSNACIWNVNDMGKITYAVCDDNNICGAGYRNCDRCSSSTAMRCMNSCRCGPKDYQYSDGTHGNPNCEADVCKTCTGMDDLQSCMLPCKGDRYEWCYEECSDCLGCSEKCRVMCGSFNHCFANGKVQCEANPVFECNECTAKAGADCGKCDLYSHCEPYCNLDSAMYCKTECGCGPFDSTNENSDCLGPRCRSCRSSLARKCMKRMFCLFSELKTCRRNYLLIQHKQLAMI